MAIVDHVLALGPSVTLVALAAGTLYAAFCRLTHMSEQTTQPEVRRAFALLAVAALATVFAVLFWDYRPAWPAVLLPVAYLVVMRASRRLWGTGQPKGYDR